MLLMQAPDALTGVMRVVCCGIYGKAEMEMKWKWKQKTHQSLVHAVFPTWSCAL